MSGMPRKPHQLRLSQKLAGPESDSDTRGTSRSLRRQQRPDGHFCPVCKALMLSSQRRPVRLESCRHAICSRCCSGLSLTAVVACPTCRASAVRGLPDETLHADIVNFPAGAETKTYQLASATRSQNASDADVPDEGDQESGAESGGEAPQLQQIQRIRPADSSLTDQPNFKCHLLPGLLHPQPQLAAPPHWQQQLTMISERMRVLDSSLSQLRGELDGLTGELAGELARDRQLRQTEMETRETIDRLQEELRQLGEQRSQSRDSLVVVESQIDAKKRAIQVAFTAHHSMSMELIRLQSLCGCH